MKPFPLLTALLFCLAGCGGSGNDSNEELLPRVRFVIRVESGPAEAPVVDRFVVTTRDEESIALGRALLAGETTFDGWVTGKVLTGNGGYNVDQTANRSWSWRLDEDNAVFAQTAADSLQTTPSAVEADVPYWQEQVGGAAFRVAAVEDEVTIR